MSKLFTTKATAQGGRGGHVKSDDGIIDLDVVMPTENTDKEGTNPEQLFAAAYSACFDGALNLVAQNNNKDIDSTTIAEVSFMKDESDGGFKIDVKLISEMSGVSQEEADNLIKEAHKVCPYSKATRDNVNVELEAKAK
ncbi:organic hydroperoxide resistance protein [Tenuibacillus multivorans]|uniref:Peroxiredoxin, Ohr subfamily n=1 Tax=Tenuibacillus multivorans TaxID=237069 RepID=A0A1H0B8I3_9BACI|nr:organic hydroperoxide resistance protein [Tenuibacillus multivorans]GEL78610.1 organic hydroperoxide resistance protein OhrB [Tenuibacillus multivorans]SDN41673.1 peroxiredoxin, Ohr subfamily [Tenuibacillus multivorans]